MESTLVLNQDEHLPHPSYEVHPVMLVDFGTTMAEVLLILDAQLSGEEHLVPYRGVVVDSLSYEDFLVRMTQNGYPKEQVKRVIPPSHYFHLKSPFTETFDWKNPLNRVWIPTLFDAKLQQIASKNNAPGSAKTPAFGKARVEANMEELRRFFGQHLHALTARGDRTLALKPGIKVFFLTTFRGGTGTGGSTTGAALLKKRSGLQIYLHTLMPCIFEGDRREHANALAAALENLESHRYGGGISTLEEKWLPPPYTAATYTFFTNGRTTITPRDALMQEAAILTTYLRPAAQSAIAAREVDLAEVMPFDLNDEPMHCRQETALSIETVQLDKLDYLASSWVREYLYALRTRLDSWMQSRLLSPEEEKQVRHVLDVTVSELGLNVEALIARLSGNPTPAHTLRTYFEKARGMIASMGAEDIKKNVLGMPAQIQTAFAGFEKHWMQQAGQLAQSMPREISNYIKSKLEATPHLIIAALMAIGHYLQELSQQVGGASQQQNRIRDQYNHEFGQALNELKETRPILGLFKKDEVARDAALRAIDVALAASLARIQQQQFELLYRVLSGEIHTRDASGHPVTLPSVAASLRDEELLLTAQIRTEMKKRLEQLEAYLEEVGQRIDKTSQVFQRSLLLDRMGREALDGEVTKLRAEYPKPPPAVIDYLKGRASYKQVVEALKPLLPQYSESGKRLSEVIMDDPAKRNLVIKLLRGSYPFTPIDAVVERQQKLSNREDHLIILQLPGGQEGPLADLMLEERIVTSRNQIVESTDGRIRYYYMRDGLPYYALKPFLSEYRESYESYLSNPAAVSPHTRAASQHFHGIEQPRTSLVDHVHGLIFEVMSVLENCITRKPSGGYVLNYEEETPQGPRVNRTQEFARFQGVVNWLAKETSVRKDFEQMLTARLDADADAYIEALRGALAITTQEHEQYYLEAALLNLGVDPSRFQ